MLALASMKMKVQRNTLSSKKFFQSTKLKIINFNYFHEGSFKPKFKLFNPKKKKGLNSFIKEKRPLKF